MKTLVENIYLIILFGSAPLTIIWLVWGLSYAFAFYLITVVVNVIIGYMAGRSGRWSIVDLISIFIGPGTTIYLLIAAAFYREEQDDQRR